MFSDSTLTEALSPRKFHLILMPTEKCNFRCTYCYEDFLIGRMPPGVVEGIKRLLAARVPTLSVLHVTWFGGEPLVASDLVLQLGGYAHELCRKHGVEFAANITTNGYGLTGDLFPRLLDISHTDYQITFDGDEEWHDRTRVLANGRATFARIWANMEACREAQGPFHIAFRLHVHEENVESVKRLYGRLRKEFLQDRRFRAFFHKVSRLSARPIKEGVLDKKGYLEALAYITDGASTRVSRASGLSEEHLDGYICYAAKPNSLMIRADGRIGKCTVALQDPLNDLGRIKEDGTVAINNEKLRLWFEGFGTLSEQTLGCPAVTLKQAKPPKDFVIAPSEIGRHRADPVKGLAEQI